jgi:hypothetical protein
LSRGGPVRIWELVSGAAILGVAALVIQVLRTQAAIRADVGERLRQPTTWLVGMPALLFVLAVGIPYSKSTCSAGRRQSP